MGGRPGDPARVFEGRRLYRIEAACGRSGDVGHGEVAEGWVQFREVLYLDGVVMSRVGVAITCAIKPITDCDQADGWAMKWSRL